MSTTTDFTDTSAYDEQMRLFLDRVRARTDVSEAEAWTLARATLRNLSAFVSEAQAEALSGALPGDLATEVTSSRSRVGGYDAGVFLEAVAGHIGASSSDEAEQRVRAVLSTVRAWAPDGQLEGTLAGFSPDLAVLFA